jgi:hypothetical protein
VKLVLRRLGRLEARYAIGLSPRQMPGLRLIVTRVQDEPGAPPVSTCTRYVRDDSLTEIVRLTGEDSGINGDELERFIDGFPIEAAGTR